MKNYLAAFTLFMSLGLTSHADELGKRVEIYDDNSGPRFTTIFSYDTDKLWMLTMTLWGRDLLPTNTMTTLSWRLYDAKSNKFVDTWKTAVNNSSPTLYPGTMAFSLGVNEESEILAAIKALPNLKLLLAVDQDLAAPVPTHYVDLGAHCRSHPKNFVNLTSGGNGCSAPFSPP